MFKLQGCVFAEQEVEALGHVVVPEGIKTDHTKTEKISNARGPIRRRNFVPLLIFCSFPRSFKHGLAKVRAPLKGLHSKKVPFA